jgi:tetratricopeptide (TPR) repeat protein
MTTEATETTNVPETDERPQHPFEQGLALYEQKAPYEEIIPLFEQGLTLAPRDSVGYTCLAWLHLLRNQNDDIEKALTYAHKAVRLDQNNYQAHINLVLAMLVSGASGVRPVFQKAMAKIQNEEDRQEALDNLKEALERHPDMAAAQKVLNWMQA